MENLTAPFQAAFARSTELYGAQLNPDLDLDVSRSYGHAVVRAVVADFRDGVVKSALDLPGNCFHAVLDASYVLLEMGIDNAVTIGNVSVNGRPHFDISAASVERDVREGFQPWEHVTNAHAWLTLDSGQVLDPTILPSWAYHEEGRELALDEAIYLGAVTDHPCINHEPFITGFAYHLHVLSHPVLLPAAFQRFGKWMNDAEIYKRSIRMRRVV